MQHTLTKEEQIKILNKKVLTLTYEKEKCIREYGSYCDSCPISKFGTNTCAKLNQSYTSVNSDKGSDLKMMVYSDLGISSPELDAYTECPHFSNGTDFGLNNASSKGGLITRYYEDENYARAYCVMDYDGGIMILYEKESKKYRIIILGEDDGNWFPKESWSFDKLDFITCYSECLSIFNNNFKENKNEIKGITSCFYKNRR